MSLTIFLHNKCPEIDIIRWFLDDKRLLTWAKAPIITMSSSEFRSQGYDWICQHFDEYKKVRLTDQAKSKNTELFGTKTVKQVMEDSDGVEMGVYDAEWFLTPFVVRRNSFPNGMEILEKEKRRTLPANCAPEIFWQTFDEVFQFTHWYST